MVKKICSLLCIVYIAVFMRGAIACTGITLTSADGAQIVARTIEWGGSELNSKYVIVPRGHPHAAMLSAISSGDNATGLEFAAKYGYVGLSVEQPEFVAEGINEAGLSAGLFYFPGYGSYQEYDPARQNVTISDLELVRWILANFETLEQIERAINDIHIVSLDSRMGALHWRIADASGRQVVLEIVDGRANFYENKLGVLTNSPGFEWHRTNLNNYVNLRPGNAAAQQLRGVSLESFGAGTGFLGLPGDMTPVSRFIRAAFLSANSVPRPSATEAILQSFHILNNFDIPPDIEFENGIPSVIMPSATQWTSATDITNRVIYYRTMYDASIRKIDLDKIDFAATEYRVMPLDILKHQPIVEIEVK